MTQGPDHSIDDDSRLFTEYGEFVLLLDADPGILREAIKDCSQEKKRRIIQVIEDQLNDTPIEGNEALFKRHLYVWMFTIRQLDTDEQQLMLNATEWELDQFY